MSETRDGIREGGNLIAAQKELYPLVSKHAIIFSLLYDLDLLPEQVSKAPEIVHCLLIIEHFRVALDLQREQLAEELKPVVWALDSGLQELRRLVLLAHDRKVLCPDARMAITAMKEALAILKSKSIKA